MSSARDSTPPFTASTSSSTTKVEIIQRQRERSGSASSQSSLGNTIDFYGLNTKPSVERFNRPSSPPTANSSTVPNSPRSHTASILPSASFFNPKRATSDFNTITNSTSQRRGNGPLITRVASAIGDSPSLAQATSAGRASPITSASANLTGESGRRYSYAAAEASDDEVDSQLGGGGLSAARLARVSRSQSQDRSAAVGKAGGWAGSRSSFEQLGGGGGGAGAGSIGRSSFDHDDRGASSSSLGHGHAQHESSSSSDHALPQASRDRLIYGESTPRAQQGASPRLADYPEGNSSGFKEGAIARARASLSGSPRASPRDEQGGWGESSQGGHGAGGGGGATRRTVGGVQLMDVETSGEYEREPKSSSSPTVPAARLPPQQQQQHTAVSLLPLVDASGRKLRNYQLHPGSNRFFLQGRALSSRDNPTPFLISLALAILLPVLFFAFSGPFLWSHLGAGGKASIFVFVYMCAVMWTSMCKTAWRDPGIVPRNLDLTPERKWVDNLHGEGNGGWRAEPRYMRIGEGVVASKWCETCETYRPPRTSHCRLCDNCVDHTDHHCTFLNNCIGRRNYTSFIAFLVSSILCAIYALSFSAWHIARRHALAQNGEAWASRWDVAGSFVVAVLSFALLCPIAGLMSYHMRLLWSNRTTIEMLRPKGDRSGAINPADGKAMGNLYSLQSPFANIVSLLCRPMELPSWIEPHQYATKDAREGEEGQGNKDREGAV